MPYLIAFALLMLLVVWAVDAAGLLHGSWKPILMGSSLALAGVTLIAQGFGIFGIGLFVALPLVLGFVTARLALRRRPQVRFSRLSGIVLLTFGAAAVLLLAFGGEGMVCLLMAAPLVIPLALLGAWLALKMDAWRQAPARATGLLLVLLMPGGLGAERLLGPPTAVLAVHTAVEVAAPPDVVWRHVVAFPPLPPPRDLLFRAGVAYPQRAEIAGRGVGAIRRCVFSTGAFVEPITIWDEPHRLHFTVTDNPPTLEELSPWDIHPRHTRGYLVSREGEFVLTPLPGGRTLLAGTTWYQHALRPAAYWRLWTDMILHRIHRRVLDQIKQRSEEEEVGRQLRFAQGTPR